MYSNGHALIKFTVPTRSQPFIFQIPAIHGPKEKNPGLPQIQLSHLLPYEIHKCCVPAFFKWPTVRYSPFHPSRLCPRRHSGAVRQSSCLHQIHRNGGIRDASSGRKFSGMAPSKQGKARPERAGLSKYGTWLYVPPTCPWT